MEGEKKVKLKEKSRMNKIIKDKRKRERDG